MKIEELGSFEQLINTANDHWDQRHIWDKVLQKRPSKTCGRQPLKNLK